MPQLYNDNVGEVLRRYNQDTAVNVSVGGGNVSATGVQQLIAGINITLDPPDGQGVVTVNAEGFLSPWIHFDVSNTANALQFSNVNLSVYDYGNQLNVFRNGILIDPAKISKVGANTIQINECLFAGDTVDVLSQSLAEQGTDSELSVLANGAVVGTANALNFVGATITVVNNQANITIPSSYGNANVAAFLPTYGGNLVSLAGNVITTANVSGTYILGNGAFLTGITTSGSNYSNANVANYLQVLTSNVTTTANIQAGFFKGDGRFLTNVNVSAGVASITSGGNLTVSPANGVGAVTLTSRLYGNAYGYNSYQANVGNVFLRGLGQIRYDSYVQASDSPPFKINKHYTCVGTPGLTIGNISLTPGNSIENYSVTQVTVSGSSGLNINPDNYYRFFVSRDPQDPYPTQASFCGYANTVDGNDVATITDIFSINDQGTPGIDTVISNGAVFGTFITQPLQEIDTPYLVNGNTANGVNDFDFTNFTAGPNISLVIQPQTIGANTGPNLTISLAVTNASSPSNTGNSQGWLQFTLGNGAPAWVPYYR